MDFRRCFSFRPPRPIGDSIYLVPQMENYSLFAAPFFDLTKKIEKYGAGDKQDLKSQMDEKAPVRRTRLAKKKEEEEEGQKLSSEAAQAVDSFGIVLNVAAVKPRQLAITFGDGNRIEVKVQQDKEKSDYGSIPFSRKCTYKYELPDDIDKNSLVALWTSDDYLIILPKDNLRSGLFKRSISAPEKLAQSADKDAVIPKKATEIKILDEAAECKQSTSRIEETTPTTDSDHGANELLTIEDYAANCEIPVHPVTRMLRPGLDIFMLRKYLVDFESYASTARKFVENASFISHNSKTAERHIRFLAKLQADKFYEEKNIKGDKLTKKREPSPDSGYSTLGKTETKSKLASN